MARMLLHDRDPQRFPDVPPPSEETADDAEVDRLFDAYAALGLDPFRYLGDRI